MLVEHKNLWESTNLQFNDWSGEPYLIKTLHLLRPSYDYSYERQDTALKIEHFSPLK